MAKFTRVSIIEPSHFDAGTAYVAANRYQLDDLRPYLWKTTISNGMMRRRPRIYAKHGVSFELGSRSSRIRLRSNGWTIARTMARIVSY